MIYKHYQCLFFKKFTPGRYNPNIMVSWSSHSIINTQSLGNKSGSDKTQPYYFRGYCLKALGIVSLSFPYVKLFWYARSLLSVIPLVVWNLVIIYSNLVVASSSKIQIVFFKDFSYRECSNLMLYAKKFNCFDTNT